MTENTITGLRKQQWGIEGGTAAVGTATLAVQPTAAETFVIGAQTYTWVASGASAQGEINVGADLAAAKVNFKAAVNGTDGWNAANPAAVVGVLSTNDYPVTARIAGTGGNSIVFTEAMVGSGNVFNGSGVLGGTTPGSLTGSHGTAVAATSQIAVEKLEWDDSDEKIVRPSFANGLLIRNRGNATAVEHGTRFSTGDEPMVWEQLMHWLCMGVTGQPTVVYTGGVYRWTFTRNPATNPNPASFTIERRFSDGNGNYVDQRASYAMLEEFSLKWAENDTVKLSAKGFARKFNTNTLTAALSLPTSELGVSALSTVYADSTWGSIGGTLLAEQVVGWELMVKTGFYPLYTAEGRTDLDFTKHQVDAQNVQLGLKMTLLLDPATYATESAAALAGTRRAIQIKVLGSGSRSLKINGLFQYAKPALFKIGEQAGQDVVDIELEEATDNTNFLQFILDHPTVYTLA